MYFSVLLVIVGCLACYTSQGAMAVPLSSFYAYGTSNGDYAIGPHDDASRELALSEDFIFFGTSYSLIYVNSNGIIAWNQTSVSYDPEPFPQSIPIIAPFWADVDVSCGYGDVYYRQTTSNSIRCIAASDIQDNFPLSDPFHPSMVVIVTWDHVPYYSCSLTPDNKTNTFQLVLATDGSRSFALFLYLDDGIQWTTGYSTNSSNGLGGNEAQVGYDAGNYVNYYIVPGSMTPNVVDIETTSNVGVNGLYILQIHAEPSTLPSTTTGLTTEPPAVPCTTTYLTTESPTCTTTSTTIVLTTTVLTTTVLTTTVLTTTVLTTEPTTVSSTTTDLTTTPSTTTVLSIEPTTISSTTTDLTTEPPTIPSTTTDLTIEPTIIPTIISSPPATYTTALPNIQPASGSTTQIAVKDYNFTIQFTITKDSPLVETAKIEWKYQKDLTSEEVTLPPSLDSQQQQRYYLSDDRMSLTIRNIQVSDGGFYTLTASNAAGISKSTISLAVHDSDCSLATGVSVSLTLVVTALLSSLLTLLVIWCLQVHERKKNIPPTDLDIIYDIPDSNLGNKHPEIFRNPSYGHVDFNSSSTQM